MTISVTDRPISLAPEWAPQKAIWTAWPANPAAWYGDLEAPRRDVAAMVRALSDGNRVRLLVNGAEAEASARAALGDAADFVPARYGDIWLRDTGPIFARTRWRPGRSQVQDQQLGAASSICPTTRRSATTSPASLVGLF